MDLPQERESAHLRFPRLTAALMVGGLMLAGCAEDDTSESNFGVINPEMQAEFSEAATQTSTVELNAKQSAEVDAAITVATNRMVDEFNNSFEERGGTYTLNGTDIPMNSMQDVLGHDGFYFASFGYGSFRTNEAGDTVLSISNFGYDGAIDSRIERVGPVDEQAIPAGDAVSFTLEYWPQVKKEDGDLILTHDTGDTTRVSFERNPDSGNWQMTTEVVESRDFGSAEEQLATAIDYITGEEAIYATSEIGRF